ncbi:hypothetical protein CO051_04350 [Candidatus Roizmanbacteria bacterium CG_4_9_14_0_2_um_filter_39_13]|uniref:DUF86 domain-containing protein n=1 Tax=Candidatus Roizmanbacteria bacterium CG_4_9_14_0_2_um_filter_39_13 TaxID=1974839 RepID=A0A2M8EY17_9BACT|nr:MAG: hypothetical protein COY15_05440 [Candidatus Roizmanbacteria bacterium CG_4_10_14_0_2_um_filter_39_12]PJC31102.1 MAG: hypothetical protein CO051_04350 [Candidatus Roizmanbacteria bacterium CG_4_9_14_0_2_um_filter_39_13]
MRRTAPERIQDIQDQINHILEATKYVPMDIREKYSEIPWKKMAGMRDVAIHDYADLNILRVWKTIQKDIPLLKKQIDKIAT